MHEIKKINKRKLKCSFDTKHLQTTNEIKKYLQTLKKYFKNN